MKKEEGEVGWIRETVEIWKEELYIQSLIRKRRDTSKTSVAQIVTLVPETTIGMYPKFGPTWDYIDTFIRTTRNCYTTIIFRVSKLSTLMNVIYYFLIYSILLYFIGQVTVRCTICKLVTNDSNNTDIYNYNSYYDHYHYKVHEITF